MVLPSEKNSGEFRPPLNITFYFYRLLFSEFGTFTDKQYPITLFFFRKKRPMCTYKS